MDLHISNTVDTNIIIIVAEDTFEIILIRFAFLKSPLFSNIFTKNVLPSEINVIPIKYLISVSILSPLNAHNIFD